jgi:hypothetical protein
LSIADNARDAVLLHVSPSNERQECENKTGLKKNTKFEILKHHDVYVSFCTVVLFHRVPGYTFTSRRILSLIITLKIKLPQIILYPRHTKMDMLEK